jgi:hypothetical protein
MQLQKLKVLPLTVDVTSGLVKSHAGLFKICVEVLTIEKCVYYIQYAKDFLNGKNLYKTIFSTFKVAEN